MVRRSNVRSAERAKSPFGWRSSNQCPLVPQGLARAGALSGQRMPRQFQRCVGRWLRTLAAGSGDETGSGFAGGGSLVAVPLRANHVTRDRAV